MAPPTSFTTGSSNTAAGPDPATSIRNERAAAKFNPEEMHYFLEGSVERAELNKTLIQQMERDPILRVSAKDYDLSKDEERELVAQRIARYAQYLESEPFDVFQKRLSLIGVFDPQTSTRIGVNLGLFVSCIRGNGTAEQINYWAFTKETAYLKGIYGCFGMTELAHGSNIMGLETTATFDQDEDEFIINTPHIGATKWWIGGAAHSATHCTVYARLVVHGTDYGVKTFVVPLRDSNHDLMPGVTVGDIGKKMGRDGIDNGWIQFSNVRIPRFFMLQKFCTVSREGEVVLPPLEQLAYSALLGGRVMMVLDSFRTSAKFATIALRYAVGRRQFKADLAPEGAAENQLLDYPLHQRRLLPYLALAFVLSSGALKLEANIEDTLSGLDAAVEEQDMNLILASIEKMKSLFIDSGCLKSTCTWITAEVIDNCRQACGGHGYSSYNGFGKAYNDWVVQCTWEGDNSVLALSIGKPIVKHVQAVFKEGKIVKGSSSFLTDAKKFDNKENILKTKEDLLDIKKVLRAIEVAIMRLAIQGVKVLDANKGSFDSIGAESLAISKLKAHHYLLTEFNRRLEELDNKTLVPYLAKLQQLYSASIVLEKFNGEFLAHNIYSTELAGYNITTNVPQLCLDIRPHVIPLTDSFQQSDMILNSGIGNYDGNIYENYFDIVKSQNPPIETKAPYSAALEAMLNRPSKGDRERQERSDEAAAILSK